MDGLTTHLTQVIEENGPLKLDHFMQLALSDQQHGYYTTKAPFGRAGDFITAPEISQLFGELIGIWAIDVWQKMGEPDDFYLIEPGPGRATMMADILRTLTKLSPAMLKALDLCLIEISPTLRAHQQSTLAPFGCTINWSPALDALDKKPVLMLANEFLDALPIRQFQFQQQRWYERVIGLGDGGGLQWGLVPARFSPPPNLLPKAGDIFELNEQAHAFTAKTADHIQNYGGAALFIDYGHFETSFGNTVQAVKDHRFVDVLSNPGSSDLTAHVDFAPLVALGKTRNLQVKCATQGDFLLAMGLLQRAGRLGANLSPAQQNDIQNDVERLAGPSGMGTLFKVMAFADDRIMPHGFD